MRKMLQKNSSLILFTCIILLEVIVHIYIQQWPRAHTPEGKITVVNNDDSYYISVIRQSMDGAWKFKEPHTTRPTPTIIVYVFYILAGKIAVLFQINPELMYILLRVAGGIIASVVSYIFIIKVLPKHLHTLGVLFTFCVETAPQLIDVYTKPFISWGASATGRVIIAHQFDSAHHRFAEAIGLALLLLLMKPRGKNTIGYILSIAILTAIGVFTSPSAMGVFALTIYLPYTIVHLIQNRKISHVLPMTITLGVIAAIGVWMNHEFAKGLPWSRFNEVESNWFPTMTILIQYAHATLLYIPWILLYVLLPKRKLVQSTLPWLMTGWILLPVILIYAKPFLPLIPFASWRIAWGIPTVPLAVLATLGADSFMKRFSRTAIFSYSCITIFFLGSLLLSVKFTNNILILKEFENYPQIYPPMDLLSSFHFLETLPKQSGILTAPTYGEIIPAYANVRTFIGPPHAYLDWDDRNWTSYYFFSKKKSEKEAYDILEQNDISYVFYGPEEQSYGDITLPLYPTLLTPIFTLPRVTIFQVKSPSSIVIEKE